MQQAMAEPIVGKIPVTAAGVGAVQPAPSFGGAGADQDWSLTSLRENLITIGAKVAGHGRHIALQAATVAIPPQLFQKILRLIAELRAAAPWPYRPSADHPRKESSNSCRNSAPSARGSEDSKGEISSGSARRWQPRR